MILKDVIDVLEQTTSEHYAYLNKKTHEIVWVDDEYFKIAENINPNDELTKYSEWERAAIKTMVIVLYSDDYIAFPSIYDIFEYQIIKRFCYDLPESLVEFFLNEINKKGAFKNFYNLLNKHNLKEQWHKFKLKELTKIATNWCFENNVKYIVDK